MKVFEELGFSTRHLDYYEIVDELIHRYIETSSACEWTEYERFKADLKRLQTKTN
nr:MAG TPA: hypothetical protein [Caudoviricetes sp.]